MSCSLQPVGALLTSIQLNSPLIIILCNSKNGNPQETIKQEECLRSSLQLFCGGPPASSWSRLAHDFFRQLHAAIADSGLWNSISPASSWLPPPSTSGTPSSISRVFGYLQLYHRHTTDTQERESASVYENPPGCPSVSTPE